MMSIYDHRFATYDGATGMSLPAVTDAQHDEPGYEPLPRYWVAEDEVTKALGDTWTSSYLFGWRWITAATNERTFVSGNFPLAGAGNSFVAVDSDAGQPAGLQAIWSSLIMDFVARQKLSGSNMAFFIVKQFACPTPAAFADTYPWLGVTLDSWLTPRVLELSYTSTALASFARDAGDDGAPFRWEPDRRTALRAEIDAAMFHLYDLTRDEVEHVLDSFTVMKKYDLAAHGELRTRALVLGYYDAMSAAAATGIPYATTITPAPGLGRRHQIGAE
jgi:hypothetical protein